uniref:Ankyrin repeat domain-containing protein n=5 Tax=Schistocephalus solidus TaxID=70667 RepID=A0A0X3NNA0_SCHSO
MELIEKRETPFPLHYSIYNGIDMVEAVAKATPKQLDAQDQYGNTALHIAAMLNDNDSISRLLALGCRVDIRNNEGWRAVDEMISLKNRTMVTQAFLSYRDHILKEGTADKISDKLLKMSDCALEFYWELKSWVPFISHFLPSDVCKLWKKGNKVRMDTSLLDFNNRSWVRGRLSILLDGSKPFDERICILDHEKQCYEIMDGIMAKTNDNWLEQTIDMATRNELVHMIVQTEGMRCKTQSSKLIWNKDPVKERIGIFDTTLYTINNVKVIVKKRTEHLTKAEKRYNVMLKTHLRHGALNDALKLAQSRKPGPPKDGPAERLTPRWTWAHYESGLLCDTQLYIGKKPELKVQPRDIKLSVAMTDDVQLSPTHLIDLFQIFSPLRKFRRLRLSLAQGLPPGFPVRIEVPVMPSLIGRLVFTSIKDYGLPGQGQGEVPIPDEYFSIPDDYKTKDML